MSPESQPIPRSTAVAMMCLAITIDVLDFIGIPLFFAGTTADVCVAFIFWNWLGNYGVRLYGDRYVLGSLAITGLEAVPVINALAPGWTVRIASILRRERKVRSAV